MESDIIVKSPIIETVPDGKLWDMFKQEYQKKYPEYMEALAQWESVNRQRD